MSTPGPLSVQYRPREFRVPGFILLPQGLVPDGEPTFDEWSALAPFLRDAQGSVHWWIGDWLNYGERHWGEKYAEVMEATGFRYQTLADDKWVAKKVDVSFRKENLSLDHHKVVAKLPEVEQERWLRIAEQEHYTAPRLRAEVRGATAAPAPIDGCTAGDLAAVVARGFRFGTIYADPPWEYDNRSTRGAATRHYQTMPTDEIIALPVAQLALPVSHLHLWVTKDFVREGFRVMEAWGFSYRSMFVWCKPHFNLGNYWRLAHELLLLGVRGSCVFQRKDLKSWEVFDASDHSDKPEQVALWLEDASPPPRLEMFGRRPRPGWLVWGNEIERTLFYQGLDSTESQQNGKAS